MIIINDYALKELRLKGAELLAFSIIETCTMRGNGCWHAGYSELAEAIGVTKSNTIKAVKRLEERELIKKTAGVYKGVPVVCLTSCYRGAETTPRYQNSTDRGAETTPNNNIDNNINTHSINARVRFTPPTLEEVKQYILNSGANVNAEKFYDYYTARGWKFKNGVSVKDWRACIRTWNNNGYDDTTAHAITYVQPRESIAQQTARMLANIIDK